MMACLSPPVQKCLEQCWLGDPRRVGSKVEPPRTRTSSRVSRLASLLQNSLLPATQVPCTLRTRHRSFRHRNRHGVRLRDVGLDTSALFTLQCTLLAMMQVYADDGRQLDLMHRPARLAAKCLLQPLGSEGMPQDAWADVVLLQKLMRLQALQFLEVVFRHASLASWRNKATTPAVLCDVEKFLAMCSLPEWSDPDLMEAVFQTFWHAIVRGRTDSYDVVCWALVGENPMPTLLTSMQQALKHVGLGWHVSDWHEPHPGVSVATACFKCLAEVLRVLGSEADVDVFSDVVVALSAVTAAPLPCLTSPGVMKCLHWFVMCLTYATPIFSGAPSDCVLDQNVLVAWDQCLTVAAHCLRDFPAAADHCGNVSRVATMVPLVCSRMGSPWAGSRLVAETPRGALFAWTPWSTLLQTFVAGADPGLGSPLALLLVQLTGVNRINGFPSLNSLASEQSLIILAARACGPATLRDLRRLGWHLHDGFRELSFSLQKMITAGLEEKTLVHALSKQASFDCRLPTWPCCSPGTPVIRHVEDLFGLYVEDLFNRPPLKRVCDLFELLVRHVEAVNDLYSINTNGLFGQNATMVVRLINVARAERANRERWNGTRHIWIAACVRAARMRRVQKPL
jgi:hypothetical protein